MQNDLITLKKVRSFQLINPGTITLIDSQDQGILITDIIISKTSNERIVLQINDGQTKMPIMLFDKPITNSFSFESGLLFWKGANLEIFKASEGLDLITIGYVLVDKAKDKSIFDLE